MLRAAVLILSCLMVAVGAYLCARGPAVAGAQVLGSGVVLLLATLFERWRYRNKHTSAEGAWQRTGERFVDPESGKEIEVLYDAQSGERHYREVG